MRCFETGIVRVLMVAAGIVGSGAAHGAAQRTFVASAGADANVCSITQPCRSFGRAITQTNAGGEIVVLDSAGYGAVTIGQAVSIVAPPGVYAGIAVSGGDGVTVNAPGNVVVLRGLTINGQGGNAGIAIAAAQAVHVEGVVIANMGTAGIFVNASAAVTIKDSVLRENAGSGIGVYAGTVTAENVRSERNAGHGLYVQGGSTTVGSSVFDQNAGSGIRVEGGQLSAYASVIAGNGSDGVFATAARVVLADCSIDSNFANGVYATNAGGFPPDILVNRSQIMRNGSGGTGTGIRTTGNFHGFVDLRDTTLRYNATADVDASFCCINTWKNNAAGNIVGTPGPINPF